MKTERVRHSIFFMPVLLGLASAVGLVSALLADGFWDALSWATLGAPLLAVLWALKYRRRRAPGAAWRRADLVD